ncbi:MAG: hypothetical protein OXR72_06740 [Gemmatimonadota bacterium]|nr:hypothetical protein [Gemmatimonadota bacterium]
MKTQLLKNPLHSYRGSPDHVYAYIIEKIIEAFDDKEDWEDLGRRIVDGAKEFYSTPINIASSIANMEFNVKFTPRSPLSGHISTANDTLRVGGAVKTPLGDIGAGVKVPIGGTTPATAAPDSSNTNPIPANNGGG